MDGENNTSLIAGRPKSSSGGGAFMGRIFVNALAAGKLLLCADVRRAQRKSAHRSSDARLFCRDFVGCTR
jgi:hypothetical protein